MESAMETNKGAKVVSKKKQNIVYSEVKAISHIGKKKYGTDDFETKPREPWEPREPSFEILPCNIGPNN